MARQTSFIVGLTGGIGTGKTRVADLLRDLGAAVECADRITREQQAPESPGLAAIVEAFGEEYLTPQGELDRARLGKLVFDDRDARVRLNRIMHPLVTGEYMRRTQEHLHRGTPVVVLDIALLLEGRRVGRGAGAVLPFDVIVLVYAREDQQLERVMARDGLSREDALARIRAQLPIEEKRQLADVVIDNTSSWEDTEKRVRELWEEWTA